MKNKSLLALLGLLILALMAPSVGQAAKAKPKKKKPAEVTVMTRNLYLGADLGPAIEADSICGAIDAGGEILAQVDRTNFPERAKLLAQEIKSAKADLVGLQEVALWRFQENSDFTGTEATNVRYDFLELLQTELKAIGAKYTVAVQQDEFDQELPADRDGSDATNELLCGADEDGRLTMRDVILVNDRSKLKVKNPKSGQFTNRYSVNLGGAVPINVDRGWNSLDVKVKGSKKRKGAKLHFVNTHLEAFGDPKIREAQARELFAEGGPLQTKQQLIFVGDINSGGPKDNIGPGGGGSGDPEDPLAYNALTRDFGLVDLDERQTCCYPDADLQSSTIGAYRFTHSVDHVMAKPRLKLVDAFLTGTDPTVTTPSGIVSSDHAGVVSTLKLKKKKKK